MKVLANLFRPEDHVPDSLVQKFLGLIDAFEREESELLEPGFDYPGAYANTRAMVSEAIPKWKAEPARAALDLAEAEPSSGT